MFKCNCPHEVRAGCSEPACPHYVLPRAPAAAGDAPPTQAMRERRLDYEHKTIFRWFRPKGGDDNDLVLQQLHYDGANRPEWIAVPVVMED